MPRAVWAEETKNGIRFEIGPSYGAFPTRSQLVTHRQSSCSRMYTLPYKQQQLTCMHQSFCKLPLQTLMAAANNNQLKGVPLLNNAKMIKRYLALLPVTSKGRLTKQRSNARSTRPEDKKKAHVTEEMITTDREGERRRHTCDF